MTHTKIDFPQGFIGFHCNIGLKNNDDDCLMIKSIEPAISIAMFTQSLFSGASVQLSKEVEASYNNFQGLLVLSKNANVATGQEGLDNAKEVRRLAANFLELNAEQVLIASTGIIGQNYPIEKIRSNFQNLQEPLSSISLKKAAKAIMTTDTSPKFYSIKCGDSTIVGIAKGIGMIEPNMATMLAFFFTDAKIKKKNLDNAFRNVVNRTFNATSIDTDTSTSDTAAIFSNELAEEVSSVEFTESLYQCALQLVKMIISDGEGATKSIIVNVSSARDDNQARLVAKSVVNSPLVKTAIHGCNPNWGRIIMAIGKLDTETDIIPDNVRVAFGKQEIYPAKEKIMSISDNNVLQTYLGHPEIEINIDLGISDGRYTAYGCDLSEGYIRVNADYTT